MPRRIRKPRSEVAMSPLHSVRFAPHRQPQTDKLCMKPCQSKTDFIVSICLVCLKLDISWYSQTPAIVRDIADECCRWPSNPRCEIMNIETPRKQLDLSSAIAEGDIRVLLMVLVHMTG